MCKRTGVRTFMPLLLRGLKDMHSVEVAMLFSCCEL
jgi:hypothetical protein